MQQIKLISKLGLAVIAITALSLAVAVYAFSYYYFIQTADAQAQLLPDDSVASESIIDGEVKTQDLANDNVTTAKIKNGDVKTEDLASGAIKLEVRRIPGSSARIPAGAMVFLMLSVLPELLLVVEGMT